MAKPIARFVRRIAGKGTKALFQVPVTPETPKGYVLASAVEVHGRPETYLFSCDAQGEVVSWLELEGSESGYANCDRAMGNVYEVHG